jgi:hypothetical protein
MSGSERQAAARSRLSARRGQHASDAELAAATLVAAYMLTRRMWMSMGFHIAWNDAQSGAVAA